ncbi:unnamed protein product [Ectocarpus sp. CCAP 1310/34]|nr:unnamed protein product [Ectocarpus sp. CCAP 1310/34]
MPREAIRTPFHPRRSTTSDNQLAEFIAGPITGITTEVPGIGLVTMETLARGDEPINRTHQLFGIFLALSPDEPDCAEHCNRFKYWLQDKNVGPRFLDEIVEAIAEKTQTWIPGVFSADAFPEEV